MLQLDQKITGKQLISSSCGNSFFQADFGYAQDDLVCFYQFFVDRFQVMNYNVTIVIGIAAEVELHIEGVYQSVAWGRSTIEQFLQMND